MGDANNMLPLKSAAERDAALTTFRTVWRNMLEYFTIKARGPLASVFHGESLAPSLHYYLVGPGAVDRLMDLMEDGFRG